MEHDPPSPEERVFDELVDGIHEELSVQLAMGRLESPDGERVIAISIADVVWDAFEVRRRPKPLWQEPS